MKKNFLLMIFTLLLLTNCSNSKSSEDKTIVSAKFKEKVGLTVGKGNFKVGTGSTIQIGETVDIIAKDFSYQVKRKNGDIGWLREKSMPLPQTAFLKYFKGTKTIELYSEPNFFNENTLIKQLDRSYIDKEIKIFQEKTYTGNKRVEIQLPEGTKGWVSKHDINLYPNLPESKIQSKYNGKYWIFNYKKLLKKATDKNSKWLVKKFSVPSGINTNVKGKGYSAYFYENIELYKGKSSGRTAYFYLKDDKVFEVGVKDSPDMKFVAWLPLSKMVRGFGFGNTYRNLPNLLFGISNLFDKDGPIDRILPGIIFLPIRIIVGIIMLMIALVYTMLPIVAVTLFVSIRSMNKEVSTSSLVLIQGIAGVILGHLWFLFLIYHDSYFYKQPFLAILLLPIVGTLIIAYMMKTLEYSRCPNCNYWSGFGVGSIWLSRNTSTKTTTTDTYKGDEFQGRSVKKETKITDRFKDLRKCDNCGHEWSIIREETK